MKRKLYLFLAFTCAALVGSVSPVTAQTYTCQGHWYGCDNTTYGTRYSAINHLQILDEAGNPVLDKAADGCNDASAAYGDPSAHYNVMSHINRFTLQAGLTYTVKVDLSHPRAITQTSCFIGYLDLNADGNYQSSAAEHISKNWSHSGLATGSNGAAGPTHTFTFTVPCTGVTTGNSRIRFRSEYYTYLNNQNNEHSTKETYGETEEYLIRLKLPTDIQSKFYMVDTAYVGTPVKAYHQGNAATWSWDYGADGTIDATNTEEYNMNTNTKGSYTLKHNAQNCAGKDSSFQTLEVVDPSAPVAPDFVSNKNVELIYNEITFTDLSDNGPINWEWKIYDSTQNPPVYYDNSDITSGPDNNPTFLFYDPGTFTVCLRGRNVFGWSAWKCKKDYIKINNFKEFDVTSAWGAPITEQRGKLYDVGGEFGDYYNNSSIFLNYLQVLPCNADKVHLTFTTFQMADDNDRVYVFDGPDLTGKPLHPDGGFKQSEWGSKVPFTLTANSGGFLIYYESDGNGVDEGFVATWESELGDSTAPTAGFTMPDVVYNSVPVTPTNTSMNAKGLVNYGWYGYPSSGSLISTEKEPEFNFTTDGQYTIRLYIDNCLGKDSFSKTISVVTPSGPADIDFEADKKRPVANEAVTFDVTSEEANRFEWAFIPNTVTYLNGTNANSKIPEVSFNEAGCYTVSLTAWNAINPNISSNTIVKSQHVCVLDYCEPTVLTASTDIGINNFKLTNDFENLIDNTSTFDPSGYQNFADDISTPVFFGKSYTLQVSRLTNTDEWNAKIWVDWNVDGDFDDVGELIHTEPTNSKKSFTAMLNIPDYTKAFEGRSRIRIGCAYGNDPLSSCGPAAIGEYEDYSIEFTPDNDIPVITLDGPNTVVVEKGSNTYMEPGYTAIDYSDGDITSKVVIDTDLENDVPGYYTMSYSVCDNSGNCAVVKTRIIKVVLDLTPPVITVGTSNLNIDVNDRRGCGGTKNNQMFDYMTLGVTAMDARDGDVTDLMSYDNTIVNLDMIGSYTVEFIAHDIQGNADTAYATVNVGDTKKPVILENGPIQIPIGSIWKDQTVVCDNYDDNVQLMSMAGPNGMPNTNNFGEYPVTYNATDGSGNVANTITRVYRVGDFVAPVIHLATPDTIIVDVNTEYTRVEVTAEDDYYSGDDVKVVRSGDNVNTKVLGTYEEVYTATDGAGNVSVRSRFIKVVDRVAPELSALDVKEQVGHEWWHLTGVEVYDNYDKESDLRPRIVVLDQNINFWEAGNYVISYQVTDLSGNKSNVLVRNVEISYDNAKTIGLNDLELGNMINLYPVPTAGELTVNFEGISEALSAVIVNQLGQEVMNLGAVKDGDTVDVSALASGTYFVKFVSGDKSTTKRIIKE